MSFRNHTEENFQMGGSSLDRYEGTERKKNHSRPISLFISSKEGKKYIQHIHTLQTTPFISNT